MKIGTGQMDLKHYEQRIDDLAKEIYMRMNINCNLLKTELSKLLDIKDPMLLKQSLITAFVAFDIRTFNHIVLQTHENNEFDKRIEILPRTGLGFVIKAVFERLIAEM